MTDISARLSLPFLQPGQAQKELYHNEAVALLDLAVHAAVDAVGLATPPSAPAAGACWIVGAAPTGAWSGRSGSIAGWTSGGWRFVAPREGMAVWSIADGVWAQRTGGAWVIGTIAAASVRIAGVQVVGAQAAEIADPAGGSTIDAQARAAVGSILAALRGHGLIAD